MGFARLKFCVVLFRCLVCLAAGLSTSCAALNGQGDSEKGLVKAVERFNKDLRWEDYRAASTWIAPSAQKSFWDLADRMHGTVRIIDYQLVNASVNELSGNATLRYRFYQKQNPRIQTRTLQQRWVFSEKDRVWQVEVHDLQQIMPD